MIILGSTQSLELVLGSSVTTNQLPYLVSYVESNLTFTTHIPVSANGTSNNTTIVTIVSAPAASTTRNIKSISVQNSDTTTKVVTISLNDTATTTTVLTKVTLAAGDKLEYTDVNGWRVIDSTGALKQSSGVSSVNGYTGAVTLTKSDVGLSAVPNTDATNPANIIQTSSYRFVTDTQISNFQSAYNAAVLANGGATTSLTFNTSKYYGSVASPLSTTSITYSFTNAVAGSKAIIFHNAGSEPTYPIGTYKRFGIYTPGSLNILTFEYLDSNTVLMDIAYSSTVGMQPEISAWINKGGVATGFVLTAMNQFLLDIASIRTRILRMNVMWGETLASMFIPLIVNDDSSSTPLGGPLDTNVNFVTGNWTFLGSNGGLNANSATRYIQTPFVPASISQMGLDDASFGCYYNFTATAGNATVPIANAGSTFNLNISGNGANTISMNGTTFTTGIGTLPGRFLIVSRSSSTAFDYYNNGVKTTVSNNSTSKGSSAFYFGASNTNISAGIGLIGGYFLGKGLDATQEGILRSSWSALHGKLGHTI